MSSVSVFVPTTCDSTNPPAPDRVPMRSSEVQVSDAPVASATALARIAVRPESALLLKRTIPPLIWSGPNHEFSDGAVEVVAGGTGGGGNVPKRKTLVPSFTIVPSPEMPRLNVTAPVPAPPKCSDLDICSGVLMVNAPAPFCRISGFALPKLRAVPERMRGGSVASAAASVAFSESALRRNGVAATSFVAV